MKRYVTVIPLIFFLSFLLLSCKKDGADGVDLSKNPIVTVFDNTLYEADIQGIYKRGMTTEDSLKAKKLYTDAWINEQLIYANALKNLSEKEQIDALVEAYRKSLVVTSYVSKLQEERLSQEVPDAELLSYLEKNKSFFNLKENIIKGLFLKIPKESSQLQNFKKWYKSDDEETINRIDENSLQNVVAYDNFYSYWISFDEVMENIPSATTDRVDFLKKNKTMEVEDSSFVYLLNIKEYKTIGEEAPFEYIKEPLQKAYQAEKKEEFMENLRKDLYNKALSKGNMQYYDVY